MSNNKWNVWLGLMISISYVAGCAQIIGIEDLPPLVDEDSDGCTAVAQRPAVDVIIVIDNSWSMRKPVDAVEAVLQPYFAAVLHAAGVDYRIIMLADFPPLDGRGSDAQVDPRDPTVCIGRPLAPQDCAALPEGQVKPNNGSRFFHYDVHIDTDDALSLTMSEFDDPWGDTGTVSKEPLYPGGWGQLLRAGAAKIFIAITDVESKLGSEDFETQIRDKLDQPYVFHSITAADRPDGEAWQPDEPVQTATCPTEDPPQPGDPIWHEPGEQYQQLSRNTGGLRFSLCSVFDEDPNNHSFDTIFTAIAEDVASSVSSCSE